MANSVIEIFDVFGKVIFSVDVLKPSVKTEELMKRDDVTLQWNSSTNEPIPLGSYIIVNEERFYLFYTYSPAQKSEDTFEYKPVFHSSIMRWDHLPFFLYTSSEDSVSQEMEWTLTAPPTEFMSAVLQAIYIQTGETWQYSIDASLTTSVSISFQNSSIFSGLNTIASQFKTEWWADKQNKILHLSKAAFGNPVVLEVGSNITTPSVSSPNNKSYTRFFAFGSTRNIEQDYQGANVNHLTNKRLTLDPAKYPNGYKDIKPNLSPEEVLVKTFVFNDVYPKANLTISDVRARFMWRLDGDGNKIQVGQDTEGNPIYDQYAIWYFKVPNFDFTEDLLIEGLNLSVHFESGNLTGREFELIFHSKDKKVSSLDNIPFEVNAGDFEIKFVEESSYVIPALTGLVPAAGNQIILFNIKMPAEYINSAYEELEERLNESILETQSDLNNYSFSSIPSAFNENNPNLTLGRNITYVNGNYSYSTRVLKLETQLDFSFEQKITIGNSIIKGSTQELKEEVVNANRDLNFLTSLNEMTSSLQQALQRTQKSVLEQIAKWGNIWTFDTETNVVRTGFDVVIDKSITFGGVGKPSENQGRTRLEALDDVSLENLKDLQVLTYDESEGLWVNKTISTGLDEDKLSQYLNTNNYINKDYLIETLKSYTPLSTYNTFILDNFTNGAANNALKLDGTSKGDLFSTLTSNSTNPISITVGGTTKSISQSVLRTSLGLGSAAYKTEDYFVTSTTYAAFKKSIEERVSDLESMWIFDPDNEDSIRTAYNVIVDKAISFGGVGEPSENPGVTYLNNLLDVSAESPNVDDILTWDGTYWVNKKITTGLDIDAMWTALSTVDSSRIIDLSHIPDLSSKYLSLSGGTINSTSNIALTINTTGSHSVIKLTNMNENSATIGYHYNYGAAIINGSNYLSVKNDGTPTYSGNTLIHSGNIDSYNAGSATKLQDNTAYTAWGQTFFQNGVPKSVGGNIILGTGVDYEIGTRYNSTAIELSNKIIFGAGATGLTFKGGGYSDGASYNAHRFIVAASELTALLIKNNGNVLIGPTMDNGYKLDVEGNGRFTAALTIGTTPIAEKTQDSTKYLEIDGNLVVTGAISFGGLGESTSSGGGINIDGLWQELTTPNTSRIIDATHIPDLSGKYLPLSGGMFNFPYLSPSATVSPRIGKFDRAAGSLVFQLGTSNIFDIVDSGWKNVLFRVSPDEFVYYGNNIIHSGNIGSQQVEASTYASSLAMAINISTQEALDNCLIPERLQYGYVRQVAPEPMQGKDGIILAIPWSNTNYGAQIIIDDQANNAILRTKSSGTWNGWRTFAFTDSNVASATKLQTARSIWGQSFDGNADIDGNLVLNNNISIFGKDKSLVSRRILRLNINNALVLGEGSAEAGYNTYIEGNNTYFGYGTSLNIGMALTSSGNVLVGNPTDNGNTLNVSGTGYFSDSLVAKGIGLLAEGDGTGISLYRNASYAYLYGIHASLTSTFGGHGSVTGDFATYFTMSNDANRGWIFYNGETGKGAASISVGGNATFDGSLRAGSSMLDSLTVYGSASLAAENKHYTRAGNNTYTSGWYYGTAGNEAMAFINNAAVSSFMFVQGKTAIENWESATWQSVTPALQIKQNCVAINHLWGQNVTPDYTLRVTGTAYFSDTITGTITNANNADTLDGYHASASNTPYGTIPVIQAGGWMDVGKQFEFHFDNTTGSDYSTLLRCTGNYSNVVDLPSVNGTLALLTSNVASASKLADNTAFIAWGQTFFQNGVPISVTGKPRFVYTATSSSTITESASAIVLGSNGSGMSYNSGISFNGLAMYGSGAYSYHSHAWIGLGPYTTAAAAECYPLVFATNESTTANAALIERMRITPSGNVGIGTTSPGYKLDVGGTLRATGRIYANEWIQIEGSYGLYFPSTGFDTACYIVPNTISTYGGFAVHGKKSSYHGILIGNTNAGITLMHSGVYGGLYRESAGKWLFFANDYNEITIGGAETSSTGYQLWVKGNTYVSGNIVVTGALTFGSDDRYKEKLTDVSVSLEEIAAAPLFNYLWTDRDDNKVHLGTTAQYWNSTNFRNAVCPTNNEKLWTMSYSEIAMGNTIVIARELLPIKREVSKIEKLENRVSKLERILREHNINFD